MFKRANKITSLLVAAASVATMVPAYAADVKKADSQEGTVYNAVAYKDGTAYIDGEVNDTDAGYYYKDGKFTQLDDVDSGSEVAAFGAKYAKIDDGKDYNVDLESGKVLDSDVPGDTEDDAASALRKEIKDADRYDVKDTTKSKTSGTNWGYIRGDIAALTVIPGSKFADNWYSTQILTKNGQFAKQTDATEERATTVFTDMKGNFIDADYNLGKVKVETTKESVSVENTKDTYKLLADGDTYASVSDQVVLGQDKDYIYRFANLTVNVDVDPAVVGSIKINGKDFDLNGNKFVKLPVIQKISKAQDSSDVDDAKYAKTVYNYVISDDSGKTTDSKAENYAALATADGNSSDKVEATKAQVVNGKLVLFSVQDADKASGSEAVVSGSRGDTVLLQAATLKQKNGFYYTDIEDSANITAEFSDKTDKAAVDTDVDGNIYVLDGGYIKKFDGTDDWTKIYKVDGSFDSLSTYDKDNMVAWSQGDEVYSIIGGKSTDDTKKDDTTPATTVTAGWAKNADGSWTFNKADGTKATGWFQDTTGTWYYANTAGVMAANAWAQDSAGAWYYLGGSGAMTVNAWVQSGGKYYYVGANGSMLVNTTTPDGYWVGADGAWV
jgi:hypothetical protein